MTYDTVRTDVADGVAVLTLDRPDVRNAIDRQVQADARAALATFRDDPEVGGVVFTGAGDRAFAAGADISQLRDYTLHTGLAAEMQRLYDEVEAFEKPTIAAVNGYALGGGCELALACDIRIASPTAKFGLPETMLSVLPGAGGTQRMGRLIGMGRAIELILTGRLVDAAEAHAIGLVTAVTDDPVATARETAQNILRRGPLAVQLAKLVIRTGMDADQRTGLVVERLAQALLYTTDDKREGAQAFLAKRPAAFTGS
ncbi:enoyl-CoA hydratase/isomerase family protein [Nocardia sp. CA2R105]|uniref:enoyl-CoA hydratase/isomerase family protein n=1 Tax=Nocardia coffeae TaxID=2873381 RepID=UPI001CA6B58A|nr:enoyl-CoA hydratase-related protein [Nocardia coffeae]MBY8855695.1 enoyl-CoA hydratase/isomerase family protein [Nocardia coffeae]